MKKIDWLNEMIQALEELGGNKIERRIISILKKFVE
jgi:hypothetical protein